MSAELINRRILLRRRPPRRSESRPGTRHSSPIWIGSVTAATGFALSDHLAGAGWAGSTQYAPAPVQGAVTVVKYW